MLTFGMLLLLLLQSSLRSALHANNSFANPARDAGTFNHLAVDPVSGTVFVGACNRIHQLDSELRRLRSVVTGPRLDSRQCTESFGAARCGAGGTTVYDALPTDNFNKVRYPTGY